MRNNPSGPSTKASCSGPPRRSEVARYYYLCQTPEAVRSLAVFFPVLYSNQSKGGSHESSSQESNRSPKPKELRRHFGHVYGDGRGKGLRILPKGLGL